MAEAVHVGEPRQIAERQFVFGQQRTGEQGQRGVLGTGNRDFALEALAALDPDAVHRRALANGGGVASGRRYAFSSVHWSGCWFSRAKSITWVTLVSATS